MVTPDELYEIFSQDPDIYHLVNEESLLRLKQILWDAKDTIETKIKNLNSMGFKHMTGEDEKRLNTVLSFHGLIVRLLETHYAK